MAEEKTQEVSTFSAKKKNLTLWGIAALGFVPSMIVDGGSPTAFTDVFTNFAVYILAVVTGSTMFTKKHEGEIQKLVSERDQHVTKLKSQYNEMVLALKDEYDMETKELSLLSGERRQTKKLFSGKFDRINSEFQQEKRQYLGQWNQKLGSLKILRSFWGWIFVIGFLVANYSFFSSVAKTPEPQGQVNQLAQTTEVTYWNAENIPIPYLQDSTQYVSNPDHVLSQSAVDSVNRTMRKLEDDLDVQSVVIVVNHIENDDPYRMAMDVGNKYGVGRDDRGLVIVVGYEDHAITIAPGRKLEADLTDAECRQLQDRYVIPGMKALMPDSAMIYLADAVYLTLKGKEMPQMSNFLNASDDNSGTAMGLYSCFMLIWLIFFVYKNKKYKWINSATGASLMANPFMEQPTGSGFSGGGGGFRSGGGGFSGGGGGHFGGGSFGGGGATSRW